MKFDYDVTLVRGDSERLQLQVRAKALWYRDPSLTDGSIKLCESKGTPSTYAAFIKQLWSSEDEQTRSTLQILAPPGSSYFEAFREFQKAFLSRTKVHWDDRLEESPRRRCVHLRTCGEKSHTCISVNETAGRFHLHTATDWTTKRAPSWIERCELNW